LPNASPSFRYWHSSEFPNFLRGIDATLVVTTYQAGKLIAFRAQEQRLSMLLRSFGKAMGLAVLDDRIAIGTDYQVWELRDSKELAAKLKPPGAHDACFIPRSCHVTGNIDIHEMAWGKEPHAAGQTAGPTLWIVNTMFSCLCTLDADFSFVPRWHPPFISELRRQDRCHLNGLAIVDGMPKYVTAFGETDSPEGWRPGKVNGGVIIDVESGETVARGFSMPHSPRVHDGRLWVLDSGRARLCTVDIQSGKIETVAKLPGYTRGLAFAGRFALVGLSKIREKSVFGGVPIAEQSEQRKCGVWVIDTHTGSMVATLDFQDSVEELFDLQLLYGIHCPAIMGLQKETIRNACVIAPISPISKSVLTPQPQSSPDQARYHNELGMALIRDQRYQAAMVELQRAIQFDPKYAKAHNNLGIALRGVGRPHDAVAAYRSATKLDATYAKAWSNLGSVLTELKLYDNAEKACRRAIEHEPDYAAAHINFGELCIARQRFVDGETHFQNALKIDPNSYSATVGLSRCLMQQDRYPEASRLLENMLTDYPDDPTIWKSLALIDVECERFQEAENRFCKALDFSPENATIHLDLAHLYFTQGDYRRAWPHFEKRRGDNLPDGSRSNAPRWDGASLVGKSILLHAEQGLGDTIQFSRFVAMVKDIASPQQIVLACQGKLMPILKTCAGIDQLVDLDLEMPVCDVQLPLMSVPAILDLSLEEIPSKTPYLHPQEELRVKWKGKLSGVEGKKVGIAWQGPRTYFLDHRRSLPLSSFAPLARVPGVNLMVLQKGEGREQIAKIDFPILDLGDQLDESTGAFEETAAVISHLDLVISSDTAIVHLAGALGVPVWVALPKIADWRYLMERDDSPWYPSLRLFRQRESGCWEEVFDRMAKAIEG
jgi:uncharacterized protein (TIGR03032 family)